MREAATLVELLRTRAEMHPDRVAFTFLLDGEEEGGSLTYAGLDAEARRIGAFLLEAGLRGERALLLYPPGLAFVSAYFGCLYAGVVAVPVFPPRANRTLDRVRAVVADARAAAVLATDEVIAGLAAHFEDASALGSLRCFSTDAVRAAGEWADPGVLPGDVAFLQYTSGSTSTPRGVRVTHANLRVNERMMAEAFGHAEGVVVAGWLPLYHDMGLIGNVLHPLYMGGRCVFMSPAAFLQRPVRWLRMVAKYGAETSGGPNFAYELCVDKVTEEEKAELDLSRWRVAFSGAEPVRARTLDRFAAAFAGCGFRRDAFYPCYGLAEATLFVSGGEPGGGPVVREFATDALERDRALPAAEAGGGTPLVSCGRAWQGARVEIVRPEERTPCAPGEVGEVWVAGPHVAGGYWNRAEESEETFGATLADGDGPFLRTGDLGFRQGGDLFVTGRLKDLVILRGRNLYPQDIEATAGAGHPALQPGGGAAFAVEAGGEERLAIVHEVRRTALRGLDVEAVARAVREAVAAAHEAQVHAVALIRPGTLPKTSSGKVQRRLCRKLLLGGGLDAVGSSVLGAAAGGPPAEAAPAAEEPATLQGRLRAEAARVLHLPVHAVDPEAPLAALGLDSLSAAQLAAWLEEAAGVPLDASFLLEHGSVAAACREAALRLERGETAGPEPRADADGAGEGPHALSAGQGALWFLYRLAPETSAYNLAVAVGLRGVLDPALLAGALQRVVARHAALRTVFDAGEPAQRVLPHVEVPLEQEDASSWDAARLEARLADEAHRPFRLEEAPLLRALLCRRGPDEHVLLLVAHHAVLDFRSLEIVFDELLRAHAALAEGREPLLPAVRLQQPHFARWQARMLAGEAGERLRAAWAERLRGAPFVLPLATDRPRPPTQGFRGGSVAFTLDAGLALRLRALARAEGVTLYTLLLAGYQLLLHRYTGEPDLLVGSPAAGRVRPALADVVGYLVNPVVVRARFDGEPSVREHLRRAGAEAVAALSGQAYPFERLVEQLQPERDASRSPVFQAMFVLQQAERVASATACALGLGGVAERLGGFRVESVPLPTRAAQFDLSLAMGEVDGTLAGRFHYDADLFEPATIGRMAAHFVRLLEGAAASPASPVAVLPLLGEDEAREVANRFNRTRARYPGAATPLHRLFEAQAARTPAAVALVSEGERTTYGELDARADALAAELARRGVRPETRVGVCMERGPELVVALLAVLKAGGAYVPLDPEYPSERLAHVLASAEVPLVLAQPRVVGRLPAHGADVLLVDGDGTAERPASYGDAPLSRPRAPALPPSPDNLAYVIYTSGSTGAPKGAMNSHRGVVNRLLWMQERYGLGADDVVLQKTPFSFDVSVWEFFWPLVTGARLVLAKPGGHRDPAYLAELIEREGVTTLHFVPSMLQAFLESGATGGAAVRRVMCSGEALPFELQERFFAAFPGVGLHNLYGPTEAAVDVTSWACVPGDERRMVPIGHPVANTRLHVLDAHLAAVPVGVPGELYLAGVQVGRGYLARPDLTAERFLPDAVPLEPGARMYRTGDRVRRLPGGALEFLGRVDSQVKVRGFRIEPGEIESVLLRHPGVRECAVLAAETAPGDTRLAAYVVVREPAHEPAALRDWLRERLPEYMVPPLWTVMEGLPLTPSGKLDRRALPRPAAGRGGAGGYVAPRTPAEDTLAAIWSEVLGVDRVGVHDSFFDLGGYSLLAVRVGSRVQEAFGVSLPLHTVFQAPTIEALALRIAQARLEQQSAEDVEALLAEMEADPEWDAALGGETA